MKAKHVLSLLVAILLTTGIAWAQQSPKPPAPAPDDDLVDDNFQFFVQGDGFLGVYAEDISKENQSKYNLGQVRGVGVTRIVKDSPAEKAGLKQGDVILRIDGENVTSVRKLNRVVSEIAPDQSVRVTISRGGSEQELTATMGRRSFKNVRAVSDSMTLFAQFYQHPVDGLIGMEMLRNTVTTIQYPQSLLWFERRQPTAGEHEVANLPLRFETGVPLISCRLPDAAEIQVVVDTGNDIELIVYDDGVVPLTNTRRVRYGDTTGTSFVTEGNLESLSCGDFSIGNLRTRILPRGCEQIQHL